MRITIEIDDELMCDAFRVTGLKTEQEVIEQALGLLVRLTRQAEIRQYRGKLEWHGDLNAMRSDS